MAVSNYDKRFMRSYFTANFLQDTCVVQRATITQDSMGEQVKTWANVASGVNCHVIVNNQRLVSPDRGEYYQTTYDLELAYGTDVLKGDRIINLTSLGNSYTAGTPIHITAVKPATTFIALCTVCSIDYIPGSPA